MSLLIVVGDLQSHSGYSTATRAYCSTLGPLFERVVGVDIHYSSTRPFEPFPWPIVTLEQARALASNSAFTVALSCTTPDCYVRQSGALNVGMTFWESDLVPLDPTTRKPLVELLNGMDALWLPSTHTRECFIRGGVRVPITVVPWPISKLDPRPGLPDGFVYDLDRRSVGMRLVMSVGDHLPRRLTHHSWQLVLDRLKVSSAGIPDPEQRAFICVAQDAPRKALPLLLAEWMEFKRRPEREAWSLILKTSPLDPSTAEFCFVMKFWECVEALKRQLDVRRAGVYLWNADLPEREFPRLISGSFGSIACGLGEGFCAPAAMAVLIGKPVIAPRHTAFADYIPEDYLYAYATRPARLSFLDDPLGHYDPITSWNVPAPLAISNALVRLADDDAGTRQAACKPVARSIESWCDPARIRAIVDEALGALVRREISPKEPSGRLLPLVDRDFHG
jgi:hypothetical protein